MKSKALVIDISTFEKVISKFLDSLKEKDIIEDYILNKNTRSVTVIFNPETEIPEDKDDVISKGLFRNCEAILKDLNFKDVDIKTVLLPMIGTQEEENKVIVNY